MGFVIAFCFQGSWEKEIGFSFRVVFIVSSSSAPPGGQLLGDMFYVNVPDGYYNIVQKVKYMMGLVSNLPWGTLFLTLALICLSISVPKSSDIVMTSVGYLRKLDGVTFQITAPTFQPLLARSLRFWY